MAGLTSSYCEGHSSIYILNKGHPVTLGSQWYYKYYRIMQVKMIMMNIYLYRKQSVSN